MARRRRESSKARLRSDEGLVLRVTLVGEHDAIVTLFCLEMGKVQASVRRVASVRSGFAGRFELLSRTAIRYLPGREMVTVREARLITPSFDIVGRPELQPFCQYFAELADELLPEHDPSANIYRLLGKAVQGLGAGIPTRQMARYVEYWLLRLTGHMPDERRCSLCGAELPGPGDAARIGVGRDGFVCARCASTSPGTLQMVEGLVVAAIGELRRRDLLTFGDRPLSEPRLRALALVHRTLIREVLSKELRVTSYLRRYHLDFL